MGILRCFSFAKLLDQTLQRKFNKLSVAEKRSVDDVGSIDDISSCLIDENVTGALIPHGHAIKAFPWVANDRRVLRPR